MRMYWFGNSSQCCVSCESFLGLPFLLGKLHLIKGARSSTGSPPCLQLSFPLLTQVNLQTSDGRTFPPCVVHLFSYQMIWSVHLESAGTSSSCKTSSVNALSFSCCLSPVTLFFRYFSWFCVLLALKVESFSIKQKKSVQLIARSLRL